MTTLTLIGEPFPDAEARVQALSARCLTEAIAETAPRGCSAKLIVAGDTEAPRFVSPRASVETLPLQRAALPLLWRTGVTARPLDGEFVHANTPLVPLRARTEADGSQTSVLVPHTLAWNAPELMGAGEARRYRKFVGRAARLADVLLAPTHATANELSERFDVEIQVLPLAAPHEYLGWEGAASMRGALGLPERYFVTTAPPGENGRLHWLLDAMEASEQLPPLVVLHLDGAPPPTRDSLKRRVHVVQVEDMREVGAVLSGAQLLALPQTSLGAGYEILGALSAHVPVLHGGCAVAAELALDAAVGAETDAEFASALVRLLGADGSGELTRLSFLAEDRKHSFSWRGTAWRLWELHASL